VVSQQQLDATRAAFQAGNLTIQREIAKAKASTYGAANYTVQGPWPGGTNLCGSGSNPDQGCSEADNDSNAAYVQALLWYITGDQTYANNAINIMNTYASNFQGYAGTPGHSCPSGMDCSNGPLQSGWDSEKWPRAAEIIRWGQPGGVGSGWSQSDIQAFTNMLNTVYLPVIQNGSGVNGNWDMSMIDGIMQIAVFTENASLLATARNYWLGRVPDLYYLQTVDLGNHALSPRGNPSWWGQTVFDSSTTNVAQETCRDLTHTEDSISSTILTAETDWIQGGSLYQDANSHAQERIVQSMNMMAGFESQGVQNALIPAPTNFCDTSVTKNHIKLGAGDTYAIAYNHYHNRLNDPNLADSSGTSGLRGTANVYNWILNGLLNLAETGDYGNHMTLFEALTHSTNLCQTVSNSWSNTSFSDQTGTFTATFNATPSGSPINSVMGLSDGPQSAYTSLAAIVRFNHDSGIIDAYNGTQYVPTNPSITYTAGQMYTFEFDVDVAAQTYTVWVTPVGGTKQLVGLNYAFRTSAPTLNNLSLYAATGTNNVCGFTATATTPQCQTASTTWNNTPFANEATTFTATFTATPSANPVNTLVGLTDGPQSAYTSLAAIARFNPNGQIDAYNGTTWGPPTIPYTGGTTYAFVFIVDVPHRKYKVYVTPAGGGPTTLVGQDYGFRTTANQLNNVSLFASAGSDTVCSFTPSNY